MALGASKKWLAPGLFKEVLLLNGSSSLLGILAGFPFVYILWNAFRLFIVDSQEMRLALDFRCLYLYRKMLMFTIKFALNFFLPLLSLSLLSVIYLVDRLLPALCQSPAP